MNLCADLLIFRQPMAHVTAMSGTECKIANVIIPFFFLCHPPPFHSFLGCCRNMYSYCFKLKFATPFMPDFEYQFLDSVRRSILRISPLFFQKNQVFGFILLKHQQSRFWLQMDTVAAGWHQGFLCPKQPNSMATSHCSWSRPRRMSGGTPAPTGLLWSVLKRQSCCRQCQGTAPSALCSTCQKHCGCAGASWAQLEEEHCEAEQRKMLLLLHYSLCLSLFQASLPVSPPGTELCHHQTLLNYTMISLQIARAVTPSLIT